MSNTGLQKDFRDFGKYFETAAFLTIIGIAIGIAGFIAMIFVLVAVQTLKRINQSLNNPLLSEFRSSYIRSLIARIGGVIVAIIGGVNLAVFFLIPSSLPLYISLSIPIVLLLSGVVIIYVGVAAEMKAWRNLNTFFEKNAHMFPGNLSEEGMKGCDKLRSGALLMGLWFFIIPAIIGFIFQIQGYFKLAKLKNIPTDESRIITPEPLEPQKQSFNYETKAVFCPNCGNRLSEQGSYCAMCGSEIR